MIVKARRIPGIKLTPPRKSLTRLSDRLLRDADVIFDRLKLLFLNLHRKFRTINNYCQCLDAKTAVACSTFLL